MIEIAFESAKVNRSVKVVFLALPSGVAGSNLSLSTIIKFNRFEVFL